jgi:hypothetical protein
MSLNSSHLRIAVISGLLAESSANWSAPGFTLGERQAPGGDATNSLPAKGASDESRLPTYSGNPGCR